MKKKTHTHDPIPNIQSPNTQIKIKKTPKGKQN